MRESEGERERGRNVQKVVPLPSATSKEETMSNISLLMC